MIPITPGKYIVHVDDKTGIKFKFRYLIGEYQEEFNALMDETSKRTRSKIKIAEEQIKEENKGVRFKKGELDKLISERAVRLAQSDLESSYSEDLKQGKRLIDIFLCGWEGKDLPEFPKHPDRPSNYLVQKDVAEMVTVINKYMNELSGLTNEEIKN
jgi:hypothetical protein